ncbi:MAG: hypothetical protein IH933_07440 [Euryarchaeota archaeon]|nr:hypothetical protein [Euryarchaeota archaeon]
MRRSVVIAGMVVVLAGIVVGGTSLFAPPATEEVAPETETEIELVALEDSQSEFWTSSQRA